DQAGPAREAAAGRGHRWGRRRPGNRRPARPRRPRRPAAREERRARRPGGLVGAGRLPLRHRPVVVADAGGLRPLLPPGRHHDGGAAEAGPARPGLPRVLRGPGGAPRHRRRRGGQPPALRAGRARGRRAAGGVPRLGPRGLRPRRAAVPLHQLRLRLRLRRPPGAAQRPPTGHPPLPLPGVVRRGAVRRPAAAAGARLPGRLPRLLARPRAGHVPPDELAGPRRRRPLPRRRVLPAGRGAGRGGACPWGAAAHRLRRHRHRDGAADGPAGEGRPGRGGQLPRRRRGAAHAAGRRRGRGGRPAPRRDPAAPRAAADLSRGLVGARHLRTGSRAGEPGRPRPAARAGPPLAVLHRRLAVQLRRHLRAAHPRARPGVALRVQAVGDRRLGGPGGLREPLRAGARARRPGHRKGRGG
ncbi:MAG: Phytoene dehydrogenase, partial [uncultured Nocardioides sp.]